MKLFRFMFWLILTWQVALPGQAQTYLPPPNDTAKFGLTPTQYASLRERWVRSQPVVVAFRQGEEPVAGQPIHLGGDTLFIFTNSAVPAGPDWHQDLKQLPLRELDSIALQRGGTRALREKRAEVYPLSLEFSEEGMRARQKLRQASVYQDTLFPGEDLKEAFSHSRLLRRIFPDKHFRISAGVGLGGDVVADDMMTALLQSPLSEPERGYGTTTSIDWVDIAFRFQGRYMVGWQHIARPDYSSVYSYDPSPDSYSSYSYQIGLFEHRIYGEYGLFHVDRYFTRPIEWTVGAGIIFARPEKNFFYHYSYPLNNNQYVDDYLFDRVTGQVTGLQLKTVFHYFFFPGLSLFAGLEAGFYQKWNIPEYVVPAPEPEGEITLPGHVINLNQLRFKAGVSIYL